MADDDHKKLAELCQLNYAGQFAWVRIGPLLR